MVWPYFKVYRQNSSLHNIFCDFHKMKVKEKLISGSMIYSFTLEIGFSLSNLKYFLSSWVSSFWFHSQLQLRFWVVGQWQWYLKLSFERINHFCLESELKSDCMLCYLISWHKISLWQQHIKDVSFNHFLFNLMKHIVIIISLFQMSKLTFTITK